MRRYSSSARRVAALAAALALTAACSGPGPYDPGPDPGPGPGPGPGAGDRIVYLVSHPDSLNGSEKAIRARAAELTGLPVVTIDDDVFSVDDLAGCRLVLMSKQVDDNVIANRLKATPCGILFWEENQQQLRMLATIDNDGSDGGVWHTRGQQVWVPAEAPDSLRAGLVGLVDFFDRVDEMAFGRAGQVPQTAIVLAEYSAAGGHRIVYVYERDALLADGTPAAGRRVFFGLYRDNYVHLTPGASAMFDALIRWAAE